MFNPLFPARVHTPSAPVCLRLARALLRLSMFLPALLPVTALQAAEHAVITIYHHVSEDTPPSTSLSPAQFREHMYYLRDQGFSVLPLDKVIKALHERQQVPDKTVVLTFDDGYSSVYEEAFPLLQELEFPFTVFINTQPVNDGQGGYMSWDDLRHMADAGVLIANHMINHPYMIDPLPGGSDEQRIERLRQEMLMAEQQIREQTGQSHKLLAYPFGEYDPLIKRMVADEGFIGIAQHSGAIGFDSDFQALPRFPLAGAYAELESVIPKLQSLPFKVLRQEPQSPLTDSRNPALTLQMENTGFNAAALSCYAGGEPLEIDWIDQEALLFRIQPAEDFNSRRWSYNCTAPSRENGNRFFWYSKLWIRRGD